MTKQRLFQWVGQHELGRTDQEGTVYRDYWWITNDQDELCFYGPLEGYLSPQCNQHEHVTRRLADLLQIPGATGVRQVPYVAVPKPQGRKR